MDAREKILPFAGRALACMALAFTCLCAMSCADAPDADSPSADASSSSAPSADAAQAVAATIMGQDILEDDVSAYIDSFRNGMQRTDNASWAEYLQAKGVTPEQLRTTTIYELAAPVVVRAKAEELEITVDDAAVDAQVAALHSSLLVTDDESWQQELERYGTSEDKLRQNYENKNLEEQVFDQLAKDAEPTDTDVQNYVADYLAGLSTKKIACVYSANYDNEQAALAAVNEAETVQAGIDAVKNRQEELGVSYADVGWDLNADLTPNMVNAISQLEPGQIPDAPLGESGLYFLFYVEDDYTFPSDGAHVAFEDESLEQAVKDLAGASLKKSMGGVWLQQQIQDNIVVNDMPEGLPYDVQLSESATSAGAGSADAPASADTKRGSGDGDE